MEPRLESPVTIGHILGPPSDIRGVVAGAPYSGKPQTLIHSDTVKRRFGLSENCSFSFCMLKSGLVFKVCCKTMPQL